MINWTVFWRIQIIWSLGPPILMIVAMACDDDAFELGIFLVWGVSFLFLVIAVIVLLIKAQWRRAAAYALPVMLTTLVCIFPTRAIHTAWDLADQLHVGVMRPSYMARIPPASGAAPRVAVFPLRGIFNFEVFVVYDEADNIMRRPLTADWHETLCPTECPTFMVNPAGGHFYIVATSW